MKNKPDEKIDAGGGVVYRETDKGKIEVVVIKRRGVWDLPKGKKEKGESVETCAEREVSEEIGIPALLIDHFLMKTYHEYRENNKLIGKMTYWYSMRGDDISKEFIPQTEEQIEEVRWELMEKAYELVGYKNLKPVLKELDNQIKKAQ